VEVQMGVQPRAKAVDEDHGALAGRCTGAGTVLAQHPLDGGQEELRHGHIDCVIGRVDSDSAQRDANEFEILPLVDEHFEVACGRTNRLARQRKIDLPKLRDQSWIIPNQSTYTRQVFDAAFVSSGIAPPQAQIESPSFHVSLATVAQSNLLTIAPRSAVEYYAALGKVRKLNLAQPFQPDYAVFITLRNAVSHPSVEIIRKTLRELTA